MDFKLIDYIYPITILKFKLFLNKSQWFSAEQLREYQQKGLQAILKQAARNVPFYRRFFNSNGIDPRGIRTLADLRHLPIIYKEDIRRDIDSFLAGGRWRHHPRLSHTSGSTGTALRFYLDRNTNILEFCTLWRQWGWAGYRFGDRFADLRGRVIRGGRLYSFDPRLNCLNLSSFHLTRDNVDEYVRVLRRYSPRIIRGYPSSISILASWLKERGVDDIRPLSVITSSETLLGHQRALIQEVFGCKVYDYYGQMERVAFIGECEEGRYHVHPEYGIVEVLDNDGRPVKPGEVGRIVGTSLHNMAMPFIRYATKDLAVRSTGKCPCGRQYPLIDRIDGRMEDVIVTPDGRHVGRLDAAFKYSPGIRLSQVVQEDIDDMKVRIVKGEGYCEEDTLRLMRELRKRLGDRIRIRLRFVDHIETTDMGKLKFVVSKVPPDIREKWR